MVGNMSRLFSTAARSSHTRPLARVFTCNTAARRGGAKTANHRDRDELKARALALLVTATDPLLLEAAALLAAALVRLRMADGWL